ncbi:MAG: 4-alpha-glucanotransferase [Deltaproteobacteria bacterium]|jgi:4-alpha-glucanotransferase|nr:4-alpha-glucanotransferase [Deltaproteobacteria bacterium]
MLEKRTSAILLHLTSLPGSHGIGDLGHGAFRFVDFLAAGGQSAWQFLPTGPTSTVFGSSPYMCRSVFAGNPLLISLDLLVNDGLLADENLQGDHSFSDYTVDYERVTVFKNGLLQKAFTNFTTGGGSVAFEKFCQTQKEWLEDYCLFMALRKNFDGKPWHEWPEGAARREPGALRQYRDVLADTINYHRFVQFVFFSQWHALYAYSKGKGISLIGDIPIYVAGDSADVWAHPELFKLHSQTLEPLAVAGVPPDYFSDTGQRWGNPVYRWKDAKGRKNQKLYDWWRARFNAVFSMMDMVKIDHFRGFEAYWEIPAGEETAIRGKWVKGPGKDFFTAMRAGVKELAIIAEDLGVITPDVDNMRQQLGFPGMRVLQFAFESDEKNPYLPHNFNETNTVVYTGTHDNNTTLGWFLSDKLTETTRERIRRYLNSYDDRRIAWDFVRLALSSTAALAIIPMQDILGFGEDCQMNKPGISDGNWRWRCAPRFFKETVERSLLDMTCFYNRLP